MVEIAEIAVSAAELKLGTEPVAAHGVTLSHTGGKVRYSMRARDPKVLEGVLGREVPKKIGDTDAGIACLGPDEWYVVLPDNFDLARGEGLPVSVVDVSSRALGLVLDGPRALAVLSSGCPLDLANMGVGRATRTVFETVEVVIWREAEDRWHVEVWCSFATWLWNAFIAAMHGAK
ncbi:sarcosine oxidase subunit gamma family protein [Novosphingobium sp. PASSN1]|uniref:sarcosine oxidase subunit gamma n=1 Tax=Novosphingobium sp. PASSN1 TaxID=2015561 RepID=UPI000BC4EFC4|nr:sarcosine oxidase subunit gamma family protein [Novosphingobium sp. PASSN1]OYU35360.1 MAG: sarcosine oxidase gamma subunit [Novosphingobium sp. PASSN1]